MFLYASCKQSDYLYCLFDEGIVNSLMGHLEKSEQKQMSRKDNHILLILTNYSAYNDKVEYEQKYMDKLMSILNNNDRVQVMSSVVLNICNIVHNANECFKFLNSMDRVQDMVYGYQFCISKLQGKYEVYKQLAQYYGRFIESMYKHTYYDYIKENIQKSIIKLLIHIISIMPICRESECTNAKIMIHVLKSMQYLYGNSLDNKPQLIISHKKYIYRVCNWFQNYLKEYRSKQLKGLYQQVIVQYCKTLKILYGINVP